MSVKRCEYTKEAELCHELPICGCGRPEISYEMFWKWLYYCKKSKEIYNKNEGNFEKYLEEMLLDSVCTEIDKAKVSETDLEGAYAIINEVLDQLGCTEHGSSWYGSWLTEKGEEMLKALTIARENDYDFSINAEWCYEEVDL